MAKNKSAAYGYYGGVTNENFYVPPGSPNFVPTPAKQTTFSDEDRQKIEQLIAQTAFYVQNAPNILTRKLISSLPGNIDSFVISTSAAPNDTLEYTSDTDVITWNKLDGGFF
jgi:hypothetical protein